MTGLKISYIGDRVRFFINRIHERLWIKPLLMSILSTVLVFLARFLDTTEIDRWVPSITTESLETLLSIISSSMLVIATFAVASMVSAYASASSSATPRSFSLVISDDVSQNALSTFIGSFIFSIVAQIALKNSLYDKGGRFVLFMLTILLFAIVIITFVSWVDRIARLGRIGATIKIIENAATAALLQRRSAPALHGVPADRHHHGGQPVYGNSIGYVQRVDVSKLQKYAETTQSRIVLAALPGTFSTPGRVLAYVHSETDESTELDSTQVGQAFVIGDDRKFDEDPRFGLVALSEIASRALSPAVNDPGTAIQILGSFVRLFSLWSEPLSDDEEPVFEFDRVEVPELSLHDMFADAFTGIARDGAGCVEVALRMQKAFESLALFETGSLREAAMHYSHLSLARAKLALALPEDFAAVQKIAKRVGQSDNKIYLDQQ